MSAPAYTTDLTTIDTAEATTNWAEPTATGWTGGGSQVQDVDYPYIQGSYAVLQATTKSGVAALLCNSGGAITLPTDGAYFIWQNFYSPGPSVLETYANGGLRVMIGASLANFDSWDVGGNDTGRNPYGGWQNWAVNPTVGYDDRAGTGVGNGQYVGCAVNLVNGVGKGYPHNIDVVRWGRGDARFSGGDAGSGYATFAGFATQNDNTSNRWGLLQAIAGGYLWKGQISLGESNQTTATRARNTNVATLTFATAHKFKVGDYITVTGLGGTGYNTTAAVASVPSTTSLTYSNSGTDETQTADTGGSVGCVVDFRDSNKIIFVDDTRKVTSSFNTIAIKHASSRVDWTNCTVVCLSPSTTASRGIISVVEDADVNIASCTFNGLASFTFQAASDILNSIFLNCGAVTANGACFNGSTFTGYTGSADTAQLVWDVNVDLDGNIDGCNFTMGTTSTHAIQLGTTSPTSVTIRNCTFTGYNASHSQNDSTFLVSRTTGTVTINVVGCTGNLTYKSAGATVVIASNPVSATVTVLDTATPPAAIYQARVLVLAANDTGPMPYDDTVTITNSGTTATVSHTGHGMASNDKVQISGASLWQNNGVFSITKITDDSYSYTLPSAPGSNPTGTIKATYVALEGLTDSNGEITMSRSFTSDQPVAGRARKSSAAPYKKTADFTDTISSSSGMDLTVQLLPDA